MTPLTALYFTGPLLCVCVCVCLSCLWGFLWVCQHPGGVMPTQHSNCILNMGTHTRTRTHTHTHTHTHTAVFIIQTLSWDYRDKSASFYFLFCPSSCLYHCPCAQWMYTRSLFGRTRLSLFIRLILPSASPSVHIVPPDHITSETNQQTRHLEDRQRKKASNPSNSQTPRCGCQRKRFLIHIFAANIILGFLICIAGGRRIIRICPATLAKKTALSKHKTHRFSNQKHIHMPYCSLKQGPNSMSGCCHV